jgi:hypothetical protein
MKEGSLFCIVVLYCSYEIHQDASDCVLGVFGKLLDKEGCMGLVP